MYGNGKKLIHTVQPKVFEVELQEIGLALLLLIACSPLGQAVNMKIPDFASPLFPNRPLFRFSPLV
jgi:hypothetical protein